KRRGSAFPERHHRSLQSQIPGLADEVLAEAVMRFRAGQPKAGRLIDVTRRDQDALGPQRDLLITRLPREADAFGDEPRPDAEAARRWLDQQQPQFGGALRALDEKHRTDRFALAFGDPAAFPSRIEFGDELAGDFGDQRLEI